MFCLLSGTNVITDRVTRPDPLTTYAIPWQMILIKRMDNLCDWESGSINLTSQLFSIFHVLPPCLWNNLQISLKTVLEQYKFAEYCGSSESISTFQINFQCTRLVFQNRITMGTVVRDACKIKHIFLSQQKCVFSHKV